MMLKCAHIVGCLLAVASIHCGAQAAYSVGDLSPSNGRKLYKFSITGKTAVAVGAGIGTSNGLPLEAVVGLTFSPDNKLYAVATPGTQPLLITVSTLTGALLTSVPLTGVSVNDAAQASLTFDCNGTLWMSSSLSSNLWKVDQNSGQTQLIGNLGAQITGIAARGATLFGAGGAINPQQTPMPNPNFYTIDTTTGSATQIGSYGVNSWVGAVTPAFDGSGHLWGLIASYPTQNGLTPTTWSTLAQISDTGVMTVLGSLTSGNAALKSQPMSGMAIAPPVCTGLGGVGTGGSAPVAAPMLSPAAWLMMVLGMIGLAARTVKVPARQRHENK